MMIQQNFLSNEDRIVEVEGVRVRFDPDAEIQSGDLYIGERNSGPKLMTCKEVSARCYIIPVENEYCYNTWECAKMIEVLDR